jgi:hypothetical protein
MLWGAIASFALAAIMFVLVCLGFSHGRRTPSEAQMPEFAPTTAA